MRKSTVTSGGRMLRAVGTQVGGGGDLKGAGRAAKPTRVALQRMVVDKEIVSFDEFERGCSAEFSTESESDWIEPAMHLFSSNSSQSKQCEKVYDAFNLLKISPSIQRMVVSLSSDKAMWDAVMKKEAVQELKKCFCEVGDDETASADGDPDIAIGTLRWILHSTKAKVRDSLTTSRGC
ncbi:hypothetical protein MUK42_27360 [Musa troglodytarum]|uniref:Uncharacterized protein n=1 Tax=Musa troglodytarum TaxID=320322 RepID=A0A9E7G1M9_9LILI|nr:hypothetical protein MUK42_27360 [Musa troglodytarum]